MSNITVKVFSASWCPNCPSFKKALDLAGVQYEVVDADDESTASEFEKYGVRGLPTCVIEEDGVIVRKVVGNPTSGVQEVIKFLKGE